jgi:hypothetical protein
MKIIIARYNENIDWSKQFDNVIIYNKGHVLNLFNEININNVGREGHTYYKYLYENYDSLDDYTMFLQGNPFDHTFEIITKIKNIRQQILSNTYNEKLHFLSDKIFNCSINGCIHHKGLPLIETYFNLFNCQPDKNLMFLFGAGAQFIVSKEQIHKRPRDFYLKIVNILEYSINPIEGFVIERFHGLIFNDKILINQEYNDQNIQNSQNSHNSHNGIIDNIQIQNVTDTLKPKQKQIKKINSLKIFGSNQISLV